MMCRDVRVAAALCLNTTLVTNASLLLSNFVMLLVTRFLGRRSRELPSGRGRSHADQYLSGRRPFTCSLRTRGREKRGSDVGTTCSRWQLTRVAPSGGTGHGVIAPSTNKRKETLEPRP